MSSAVPLLAAAQLTCWSAAGATPVRAPLPARWSSFDLRTFYLRDLTFTGSTIVPPGHDLQRDVVGYDRAR